MESKDEQITKAKAVYDAATKDLCLALAEMKRDYKFALENYNDVEFNAFQLYRNTLKKIEIP